MTPLASWALLIAVWLFVMFCGWALCRAAAMWTCDEAHHDDLLREGEFYCERCGEHFLEI